MIDPTYGNPADEYVDDDAEQPHPCYVCHGHQVSPAFDGHVCLNCLAYWSDPICLLVEQERTGGHLKTVTLLLDAGADTQRITARYGRILGDWINVRYQGADWHVRRERIVAAFINEK